MFSAAFGHGWSGIARLDKPARTREELGREPQADFLDRLTAVVHSARPYSWGSFVICVTCVGVATALRAAFGSTAAHFPLTFYILAILTVEVLAGLPAAVAAAVASILIVWWAFIPPFFQFTVRDFSDVPLMALFLTEAGAAILIGVWCRLALVRLHGHQAAYRTVARELAHRNKNSRALFEVIVRKSLPDDPARAEAILGRVRALGYADDLLMSPRLGSVSLQDLLAYEFAPYGLDRVCMAGPRVEVSASDARHLLLILHELVTNAAKYGALSNDEGRVDVHWHIEHGHVRLCWKENRGPAVRAPAQRGFGSTLVEQSAAALHGTIRPAFAPDGFSCLLEFSH